MKRCWDSNPKNRPNAIEILYINYFLLKKNKQFEKPKGSSIKNNDLKIYSQTHPQAIYTSRLLNSYTVIRLISQKIILIVLTVQLLTEI
jgi:hypothetical protein